MLAVLTFVSIVLLTFVLGAAVGFLLLWLLDL
jgi:hypothetical protein